VWHDVELLGRLHDHLPVALLVTSADTREVHHANRAALAFMEDGETLGALLGSRLDDHVPDLLESGFAAALDDAAATGETTHLPELRRDRCDGERSRWSWSLHRAATDRWGPVVVSLGVDVSARRASDRQRPRRLALQAALDAVPRRNPSDALSEVARALVPAISIELCTVRLRDTSGDFHLVAATGLAASELRKAALQPIPARRIRACAARSGDASEAGASRFRWVGLRWLGVRSPPTGVLGLASRSDRRPSEDEDGLLDGVALQLSDHLDGVDRAREPLRARSLELAREAGEPSAPTGGAPAALTPRHRTILELYQEGLGTQEVSDLLFISPHTVRTHVKLACRRLGVSSRAAALRMLADAADPRMPI
jgi:DNA-binding CsgD family transcriptional regulator